MGHKTVTFTNETEQRTYVQGEFTGKYHGSLNQEKWHSTFEFYDIHIYHGEINNLKNEKEHRETINETIYNSIVSETQLTQKSFENVLVNLDSPYGDYNNFRLTINDPKLESVEIYDVVKDGNQTFGTLCCFVSGYLSKISTETSEIQVETCNQCNQFLEECICNDSISSNATIVEDPVSNPSFEKSFWSRNFGSWTNSNKNWGWNFFDSSGFGCLGALGLLVGLLVLMSFGLPGILIGALILLVYAISGPFTRTFQHLTRGLKWLLYSFIGLLLLGILWYFVEQNNLVNFSSIPHDKNKTSKTQKIKESRNIGNSPQPNAKPQNEKINSSIEQNSTIETDAINDESQESFESQNIKQNNSSILDLKTRSEEVNNSSKENIILQSEKTNSYKSTSELPNIKSNNTDVRTDENQPQTQASSTRQKQSKAMEIMSGIEFHEGEVYICKGGYSKRYHFNPDCPGLSNCSTRIYQINIPAAERQGKTLCKREY
ncbi:hypothetical protein FEE95_14365 [Maribacter algarum]|uniref:Uncharacterized protein n=1 Tax=Maribacter algarum (ex Zhang et al. 2020) TaxID=2578118 RepID=A0A5S3PMY7_9FLAO|nr:hypothetical protein [Maribacter algarum]TMM55834.1 hypothetical protein FEE95_14365 [Maribacter algarum]